MKNTVTQSIIIDQDYILLGLSPEGFSLILLRNIQWDYER